MSTKFSPSTKQQAAINALGKNILVSASAGAGKTTVLINRLIKRMEVDHVSVNQIMAVTFTEMAAKEMRKRLEKSLNERYTETHNEFINQQISLLPSAQITTIHGFCLDLLKKYAYVVNFDPQRAQNVLDETQKMELMDQAFQNVYENIPVVKISDYERLVFYFSSRPENSDDLKANVIKLATKLQTIVDPQSWIDRSIKAYDAESFSTMSPQHQHYVRLYYVWQIDNLINLAQQTVRDIKDNKQYQSLISKQKDIDLLRLYYDFVELMIDALSLARQEAQKINYEHFRSLILSIAENGLMSPPLVTKDEKVEAAIKKIKGDYNNLALELFDEEQWFMDHHKLKPIIITLAELTQNFMKEYARLKVEHKAIDFDDMEHFALEILRNRHFKVNEDLKKRYVEILVDEFQDTNFVQNEIVELLSNGTNVFRVGDVKQSIYRFRNAQPEMMQAMKRFDDDTHQVLYLTENYRSTKTIVDFNNLLFDQLMNFDELDSSYTQDDQVDAGRKDDPDTEAKVEFHFIEPNLDSNGSVNLVNAQKEQPFVSEINPPFSEDVSDEMVDDPFAEPLDDVQPKAVHIANLIEDMRRTTPFKKYKDYVVLVRSNSIKEQVKAVFEKARIPHHISIKSGFFNSDAVQDVILMINYLVDPSDDINFVGLLLSKFIGYSEDRLSSLKLMTTKFQSFNQSIKTFDPETTSKLELFRENVAHADLIELLREIYTFNDYYDKFCTIQQRANLDLLSEKAQLYAQQNISRTEFLMLIKHVTEEDSSEAIPYTDEDDVVRVMTIHASKGLEFKVVFYWSQSKGSIMDLKEPLLIDSELGFSLKSLEFPKRFTRLNPNRLAMEMKTIRDDVQEQVRLLYVALTRAEERLIIVDKAPKTVFTNNHYTNILNALGPTQWMMAALDHHHTFERKTIQAASELLMHNPPLNKEEELIVVAKPKAEITFKAPSSTHKTFTHFTLNFDTNVGSNHGTLIHELFEKLPKFGVTEEQIKALSPDIKDKDIQSILAYYSDPIYSKIAQGEIHHEFPFYALLGSEVLHGYMDMVSFTSDETILIDFKTDRVDSKDTLLELYTDQLKDYVKVLQQMRPDKPVKAYMYSLALKAYVEVR